MEIQGVEVVKLSLQILAPYSLLNLCHRLNNRTAWFDVGSVFGRLQNDNCLKESEILIPTRNRFLARMMYILPPEVNDEA